MRRWAIVVVLAAGCGDNTNGNIAIVAPAAWSAALTELVALTPDPGLSLTTADNSAGFQIVLTDDAAIPLEGFRIETSSARTQIVHAHDVLGAQYGTSEALENLGFRFRHPFDTLVPFAPQLDPAATFGVTHVPEVRVRGLQLHTLHPIESYFAFWEPSSGSTNDAHRIIDWLIKNRGNFLQWVALQDIMDPTRRAAWQTFTRELIDDAHARGIRVGLNVELFGQSNLQLAFDLYDDTTGTVAVADSIAARLPLITDGLLFDVFALSYGEFFDADPQLFIDSTNAVASQLRTLAPAAEMHAVVHVGASQIVTYMGQQLLYYFLVKFADPAIVPDIHTVMYFDLFEDTGGAYQFDNFDQHRQYLVDRMCAHQKVGYFPEDAYWVAFDDSVPQYFPLYVRSRWLDRDQLPTVAPAPCAPLDEQLLFSSGWEWGYWLHDVTALRDSYEHAASAGALIAAAFAPDLGPAAAQVVAELADAQDRALITARLAPYLAGRDIAIDAGRALGVISQPDRVTFDDLAAMAPSDRAMFQATILDPLSAHLGELDGFAARLDALALPHNRWADELRDGLAIDRARIHFVLATYGETLAHLAGDPTTDDAANAALAEGAAIVARRHGDLHDTHGRRLVDRTPNQTYYQFGYLYQADTLCYWQRELDQVDNIVDGGARVLPTCLF